MFKMLLVVSVFLSTSFYTLKSSAQTEVKEYCEKKETDLIKSELAFNTAHITFLSIQEKFKNYILDTDEKGLSYNQERAILDYLISQHQLKVCDRSITELLIEVDRKRESKKKINPLKLLAQWNNLNLENSSLSKKEICLKTGEFMGKLPPLFQETLEEQNLNRLTLEIKRICESDTAPSRHVTLSMYHFLSNLEYRYKGQEFDGLYSKLNFLKKDRVKIWNELENNKMIIENFKKSGQKVNISTVSENYIKLANLRRFLLSIDFKSHEHSNLAALLDYQVDKLKYALTSQRSIYEFVEKSDLLEPQFKIVEKEIKSKIKEHLKQCASYLNLKTDEKSEQSKQKSL